MKHSIKITFVLLISFFLAQLIGIAILNNYIDIEKTQETGETTFKELPIGERPPMEETTSFIWILLAILIGTGILLLIIKFHLNIIWKIWFLIAVFISLLVAFAAFVQPEIALVLALTLGIWKVFKPNFLVQNLTELFIYGGLAAIFVPLLNLFSVTFLLVLISVYDAYAVWKSKHMITLAKSQTKAKVFAGLFIPYKLSAGKIKKTKKNKSKKIKKVKVRTAILGGGDIGFPLIFAGVMLKEFGLWQSLIIPFFAVLGLGILLWKADKKKFYPAMPFISAGCFLGLGIIFIFQYLL